MCNIAGYAGTRPAAPILIDMMRKQEGFAGGYFTGIATLHEGKLHYAKITGDLDRLLEKTDAASLPGTVGIIHSRSNSGGGDSWAHPFVSGHGAGTGIAYVANGTAGPFGVRRAEFAEISERLIEQGYPFTSLVVTENKSYLNLSNGMSIHMSDAMCQLILRYMDNGAPEAEAMAAAFCEMPGDIVGLMLSEKTPDSIFFSRINRPMMWGKAPHGSYLATTAMAMPADAAEITSLPVCASGAVRAADYTYTPYPQPPIAVAPVTDAIFESARALIEKALGEGEKTAGELLKLIPPLFEDNGCTQSAHLTYEVLRAISATKKINIRTARVTGAAAGLTAPKFYLSL